jgi:hypothetical protein
MKLHEYSNCKKKCHKIYTKARSRGISYTEMKEQISERYGVSSSRELTIEQYREILTHLDYLPIDHIAEEKLIVIQRKHFEDSLKEMENG